MSASTQFPISPTPARMGRPRINGEQTPARFPEGTLERIDAVLEDGEKRSDFIRAAVERELDRRSGATRKPLKFGTERKLPINPGRVDIVVVDQPKGRKALKA